MNDDEQHGIDTAELAIRAMIRACFMEARDGAEEGPDDPRDTISVEFTRLEVLVLLLGLNRVVGDEECPDAVRIKCAQIVSRLSTSVEDQKTKPWL